MQYGTNHLPPEREGHDAPNTKTQVTCFYKQVNSFYDMQGPELNLQTFKFSGGNTCGIYAAAKKTGCHVGDETTYTAPFNTVKGLLSHLDLLHFGHHSWCSTSTEPSPSNNKGIVI